MFSAQNIRFIYLKIFILISFFFFAFSFVCPASPVLCLCIFHSVVLALVLWQLDAHCMNFGFPVVVIVDDDAVAISSCSVYVCGTCLLLKTLVAHSHLIFIGENGCGGDIVIIKHGQAIQDSTATLSQSALNNTHTEHTHLLRFAFVVWFSLLRKSFVSTCVAASALFALNMYYYYCRDMCLLIKLSTCVIWQFSCAYAYNNTDLVPTTTTTQSTGKISLHIKRLNPKTEENFFSILSCSPGRLCVGGV